MYPMSVRHIHARMTSTTMYCDLSFITFLTALCNNKRK